MSSVADALRTARRAQGLTQEQVGRLLNPPISHTLISRYESGLRVPPQTLVQLARLFRLNLAVAEPSAGPERVAS
jgi:transcriptional regulator with XRE-family HTH domain